MTTRFGAPGTGLSRREFLAATGATGLASLSGCSAGGTNEPAATSDKPTQAQTDSPNLPYTSPPTVVNVDEQGGEVTVRTQQARHAVHPLDTMGGPVEFPRVWAFQADDNDPSVPGPILRTTEGNAMEVTLDNTDGRRPHTIHFHGVRKTWKNDGVPTTTGIQVPPGETHTYEIPANVPGTHFYHCHFQTHRHIDMGMYGVYRVDPEGYEPADREYFMTIKDWDSRVPRKWAGEADFTYNSASRNPDVFTVNGKSAPRTLHPEEGSPIIVDEGDSVRIHLVNGGYMSHPMHIHNHRFQRVEKDGGTIPEAARHDMDVTNVAPAERHTIEFTADADPGIYLMHCHKVNHVMNGTFYPGGMLTGVVYRSVMDTDIFNQLMEYAGYST
ncbi:multicopper oxidase domain-containing protein [Halomicroarcula sp. F13]|jgi:FtsP/CotA-like multicopper oxidase with cupredoxin domain|uniref:Multicopper oxidase family protein n=2 Tax=Halobacteriales TaxID=2235 RepID=A0A8J8PA67_9EURY|nr:MULTISPECIES: multicopper oxidase domain-containing protein [Halobacteria]MBX0324922.1 multicopper oxidase domain-containing protein [Halomicroarcula rubra]TQQ78689.1 multicopper oxidase family protein [Halonotius terrestris]